MPEPAKHSAAARRGLGNTRVIPVVTIERAEGAVLMRRALPRDPPML